MMHTIEELIINCTFNEQLCLMLLQYSNRINEYPRSSVLFT